MMAQPQSARSLHADCNVNVRHVRNTAAAGPPYKQHMKRRRVQPNAQSATCLPMCRSPAADAQAEEDSWLAALEQALMASSDEDTMPTPPAVVELMRIQQQQYHKHVRPMLWISYQESQAVKCNDRLLAFAS